MTNTAAEKEAERKAKNAEKMRKWRERNPPSPEKRAKEAERVRQWRKANPERSKAHYRAWKVRNRERIETEKDSFNDDRETPQAHRSPGQAE